MSLDLPDLTGLLAALSLREKDQPIEARLTAAKSNIDLVTIDDLPPEALMARRSSLERRVGRLERVRSLQYRREAAARERSAERARERWLKRVTPIVNQAQKHETPEVGMLEEPKPSETPMREAAPHENDAAATRAATVAPPTEFPPLAATFPSQHVRLVVHHLSSEELVDRLTTLYLGKTATGQVASYKEIREEACAIHFELNGRRLLAPGFRPRRPFSQKWISHTTAAPHDEAMGRDRQIVDLHWLVCTGHKKWPKDTHFRDLFSGGELNFSLAQEFACKVCTAETKAVAMLGLNAQKQIGLAAIRSEDIATKVRTVLKAADKIELRLENSITGRRGRRPDCHDLKLVWAAARLAGARSPTLVAEIHALMSGQSPQAKSTIAQKLDGLEKLLETKRS